MNVDFADRNLDRLETEDFNVEYHPTIVKAYRKRLQQIRAAVDERDFYALKSLRFEKLKGSRAHQHSVRLNDQWRLVLEVRGRGADKIVMIVGIEDYH